MVDSLLEADAIPFEEASPLEQLMLRAMSGTREPPLEMSAYLELVGELPPPTDEQIRAFAEYFCGAKSWYKHLPLRPPGERFRFFLHPQAGCARLFLTSGHARMIARTRETPSCHYSLMTTKVYRERFGFLVFSGPRTTGLSIPVECDGHEAVLDCNPSLPEIQVSPDTARGPAKEILDAGECRLTGLIHPRVLESPAMLRRLVRIIGHTESSDDDPTWSALVEHCRALVADASGPDLSSSEWVDTRLGALLAKKRSEQLTEIVDAIHRACHLIYARA